FAAARDAAGAVAVVATGRAVAATHAFLEIDDEQRRGLDLPVAEQRAGEIHDRAASGGDLEHRVGARELNLLEPLLDYPRLEDLLRHRGMRNANDLDAAERTDLGRPHRALV